MWFSFGKNLGKYIKYVRDRTESSANGSKPLIFVPVSSADEAAVAVEEWKVDAIVAQGTFLLQLLTQKLLTRSIAQVLNLGDMVFARQLHFSPYSLRFWKGFKTGPLYLLQAD
jgi:hypothetical protein